MRKTLILTKSEIMRLLTMKEALRAVEEAFRYYGMGRVQMPAKIYLHLDRYSGDFRAMPAYIEGVEAAGLKWVNVHPGNRRFGLPAVMAIIILSDPKTGFPLCIMDGTRITNLRTGAAGGVAAKYLARPGSSVVSLVGCGAQGRAQLEALDELFDIKSVNVWGNEAGSAKRFLNDMKHLGLKMRISGDIPGCVKDADIIVTTTPARKPIVRSGWVKKGTGGMKSQEK